MDTRTMERFNIYFSSPQGERAAEKLLTEFDQGFENGQETLTFRKTGQTAFSRAPNDWYIPPVGIKGKQEFFTLDPEAAVSSVKRSMIFDYMQAETDQGRLAVPTLQELFSLNPEVAVNKVKRDMALDRMMTEIEGRYVAIPTLMKERIGVRIWFGDGEGGPPPSSFRHKQTFRIPLTLQ